MGDRGNILIKSNGEQVCLYSHWGGHELGETLAKSLIRGKARTNDFQYITRIIFCDMIKGYEAELTGFGITQEIHDNERDIITFDVDKGEINGIDIDLYVESINSQKDG